MLAQVIDSPKKRLLLVAVAAALLIVGVAVAVVAGGNDEAAPTTTSTTTTVPETTTTAVPVPVAPLTGLPGDYVGRIDRPALVVKYDNVEPKARPQAGLNQADVVYEERVEGSVTRLLAIFHSTDAAPAGPVRSGRTSDIAVFSPLNKPYFAWSGANNTFAQRIRASNITDVGVDAATEHYFRAGDRPAPHDLMIRGTDPIMRIPTEGAAPPPPLFTYRAEGVQPAHLEPVGGVHVSYGTSAGAAPVDYRWNGQGWARFQSGTPHVDADGVQVAPPNVIVHFAPYLGSDVTDQFGKAIPEVQLVGEGEAWVLTAGGLVQARWHKPSLEAVITYTDVDGNPVGLTPGRTWVALAEPGNASRL